MINSTLCYITRGDEVLLLHRVKKENDVNKDKWIGIGGKFEGDETPDECLLREAKEETGLTLERWRYRGLVTFVSDKWETEYMHLYTADKFSGTMKECDEGNLEWVPREQVEHLPIWEGDKIFLRLMDTDRPFFSLKLNYTGDVLTGAVLDGKKLEI